MIKRMKVYGTIEVGVKGYCGNGGSDKLIGVEGVDESIDAGNFVSWDYAEPID